MGLQIREVKGQDSELKWTDGGTNFGYGPVESVIFFEGSWTDPITNAESQNTPVIAINSKTPIFAPLIAATMKGLLSICVSEPKDPILLLACQHASYIHRPGAIVVTEDAQSLVNLDEDELNVRVNELLTKMGLDAADILEEFGGTEGFLSQNTQYINGEKATVIVRKDEVTQAIEKGLLARYWLGKDVDVLIIDVKREDLPENIRRFQMPEINIACQGEIFAGNMQLSDGARNDEIRSFIDSGKLTIQKSKAYDVLDTFVPSRNYFG